MIVQLTDTETSMLTDFRSGAETVEDALHRLLLPFVAKYADARLQRLADEYRKLTPELQIEALRVLQVWKSSKI